MKLDIKNKMSMENKNKYEEQIKLKKFINFIFIQ